MTEALLPIYDGTRTGTQPRNLVGGNMTGPERLYAVAGVLHQLSQDPKMPVGERYFLLRQALLRVLEGRKQYLSETLGLESQLNLNTATEQYKPR